MGIAPIKVLHYYYYYYLRVSTMTGTMGTIRRRRKKQTRCTRGGRHIGVTLGSSIASSLASLTGGICPRDNQHQGYYLLMYLLKAYIITTTTRRKRDWLTELDQSILSDSFERHVFGCFFNCSHSFTPKSQSRDLGRDFANVYNYMAWPYFFVL